VNGAREDDRARSAQAVRLNAKGLKRCTTMLRTTRRERATRGEAVAVVCVGGRENDGDGEGVEEEKKTMPAVEGFIVVVEQQDGATRGGLATRSSSWHPRRAWKRLEGRRR
jgi:hypothetical protein